MKIKIEMEVLVFPYLVAFFLATLCCLPKFCHNTRDDARSAPYALVDENGDSTDLPTAIVVTAPALYITRT